jgi:DNA modification methylase
MRPYYDDGACTIYHGDCREVLPTLAADAIVTDPPYGLAFMGKAWDKPGQGFHQAWATAALQALPPGGWLLAFGGTRTWHRLACGIEDAGFEIRDTLMWLYGQGFPKGKASLKPGWEPILLARKPGSSVLQIDGCRVGFDGERVQTTWPNRTTPNSPHPMGSNAVLREYDASKGRWPANLVLTHGEGCQPVGVRKIRGTNPPGLPCRDDPRGRQSASLGRIEMNGGGQRYADPDGTEAMEAWECEPDCPVLLLDQQSGDRPTGKGAGRSFEGGNGTHPGWKRPGTAAYEKTPDAGYGDTGGASRFYYTAKAGRNERVTVDGEGHPTVKPLALMRWLVRLVTPPGGTVLDPFCGSGSTLVAAAMEGFRAVGVEADQRWCEGSARRCRDRPAVQPALPLEVI